MAVGTYTIDNPITTLTNNLTLEGGFDPANGWKKTSQAGATKIFRSNLNVEDAAGLAPRLVAIHAIGQDNIRFQDLTIEVADALPNGGIMAFLLMAFTLIIVLTIKLFVAKLLPETVELVVLV
jgi:hypothetical protein